MPHIDAERLRQLPQQAGLTWYSLLFGADQVQEGLGELRLWVLPEFPRLLGWTPEEGESPVKATFHMLADMASDPEFAGYRPAAIRTNDPALAAELRTYLDGVIEVPDAPAEQVNQEALDAAGFNSLEQMLMRLVMDQLQELGDASLEALQEILGMSADDLEPTMRPLLSGKTDVARVRAFAEAARDLYQAQPWTCLDGHNLFRIESPKPMKGLQYFNVMGQEREQFGLAFFRSKQQREDMEQLGPAMFFDSSGDAEVWSLTYEPFEDLQLGDADTWERYDLPESGEGLYPVPVKYSGIDGPVRPQAKRLAFIEGVARAVAAVIKAGPNAEAVWSISVPTAEGERTFRLRLVDGGWINRERSGRLTSG